MNTEKRNCDYYEKLDSEELKKVAHGISDILKAKQIEAKILEHNVRNILFVLEIRKTSSEEKNDSYLADHKGKTV